MVNANSLHAQTTCRRNEPRLFQRMTLEKMMGMLYWKGISPVRESGKVSFSYRFAYQGGINTLTVQITDKIWEVELVHVTRERVGRRHETTKRTIGNCENCHMWHEIYQFTVYYERASGRKLVGEEIRHHLVEPPMKARLIAEKPEPMEHFPAVGQWLNPAPPETVKAQTNRSRQTGSTRRRRGAYRVAA